MKQAYNLEAPAVLRMPTIFDMSALSRADADRLASDGSNET